MPFGAVTGLAKTLLPTGAGDALANLPGLSDSGNAISGATLGPVQVGGINPLPSTGGVPTATAVAVAAALGVTFLVLRGR